MPLVAHPDQIEAVPALSPTQPPDMVGILRVVPAFRDKL